MTASTLGRLTFRLAQSRDFDAVVKSSEGISDGHDYLSFTFHKRLQRDNLDVCFEVGPVFVEEDEYWSSFEVKVVCDN